MNEEQDWWDAILAEPLCFDRIAIFADWLQDRDDPRAEGMRAIARFGIVPHPSVMGGTLLWNVRLFCGYDFPAKLKPYTVEFNACARAMLPDPWYKRVKFPDHNGRHPNARDAYNAIALAYRPEEHP